MKNPCGAWLSWRLQDVILFLVIVSLSCWLWKPNVPRIPSEAKQIKLFWQNTSPRLLFFPKLSEEASLEKYRARVPLLLKIIHHIVYWTGCAFRIAKFATKNIYWYVYYYNNMNGEKIIARYLSLLYDPLDPFIMWSFY